MLTRLQLFKAHHKASLGVLTPAGTAPRSLPLALPLAGDSMLVSSKHSAMLCPSIPRRSTRLKSRILSKGQFIDLTTPSTPGTLTPASFTRTSLKGVEDKLANVTIADDRGKVTFDTQEATCCQVLFVRQSRRALPLAPALDAGTTLPG